MTHVWLTLGALGRLHLRMGRPDLAVSALEPAVLRLEKARVKLASQAFRSSFLDLNQRPYRDLVAALVTLDAPGESGPNIDRALHTFEKARSRTMLELVDLPASASDPRAERIQRQIADYHRQLLDPDQPDVLGLLEALDGLEAEMQRLEVDTAPDLPAREVRSPERLQTRLPADVTVVAFMHTSMGLIRFRVERGSTTARILDIDSRGLSGRVRNLVELLATSDRARWGPVARRLGRELLDGLEPDGRRLWVIPDGVLHRLPFEVLLLDDDRPLLEASVISYAPSATLLQELRRKRTVLDADPLLVFANPDLPYSSGAAGWIRTLYEDEGLLIRPIPGSAQEARALAPIAGSPEAVRVGREASEEAAKDLLRRPHRVVHFATHGLVSARSPSRSSLLLSPSSTDDGFLQAREIAEMRIPSDLVVLSACRTGRGRIGRGEGVHGLVRAFLRTGVPAVVATLWDVDDREAVALMRTFYRGLSEGATTGEALREAKRVARQHGAPASAWAAYVLIGDPDRRVVLPAAPDDSSTPGLAIGLTVLLIGIAAFLRRL